MCYHLRFRIFIQICLNVIFSKFCIEIKHIIFCGSKILDIIKDRINILLENKYIQILGGDILIMSKHCCEKWFLNQNTIWKSKIKKLLEVWRAKKTSVFKFWNTKISLYPILKFYFWYIRVFATFTYIKVYLSK